MELDKKERHYIITEDYIPLLLLTGNDQEASDIAKLTGLVTFSNKLLFLHTNRTWFLKCLSF